MEQQNQWRHYKNILCIRLDNMGDVIMTSPAIRALKGNRNDKKITLLTSSAGAPVAKFIKEIDEIIVYNTPWTKTNTQNSSESIIELTKTLYEKKFDAAVIFNVYSQSPLPAALICYLSNIPAVAGFCRENPYQLITDWFPDMEPLEKINHEISRQLQLVHQLGFSGNDSDLSLSISKKEEILADKIINHFSPSNKFMLISPGVSEERRKFSINQLAQSTKLLTEHLDYTIFIIGTQQEKPLAKEIINCSSSNKIVDLTGTMEIGELIALIKKASLLITNNTGPAHIAAATKTPVLVLYALTNPQHSPWNVPHIILPFEVPESNRSKNILIQFAHKISFRNKPKELSPNDILNAAQKLLSKEYKVPAITEVITT